MDEIVRNSASFGWPIFVLFLFMAMFGSGVAGYVWYILIPERKAREADAAARLAQADRLTAAVAALCDTSAQTLKVVGDTHLLTTRTSDAVTYILRVYASKLNAFIKIAQAAGLDLDAEIAEMRGILIAAGATAPEPTATTRRRT